jgi:hypothetical protein
MLLARMYETYYWQKPWVRDALPRLEAVGADVILANDPNTWPLAVRAARGAPVIFDAHEYSPLEYEESWQFRVFFQGYATYLCRRYIPRAAAMMTVCRGIADRYAAEFGGAPVVVMNTPEFEPLSPRPPRDGRIRLLHHGNAAPSRNLVGMMELMNHLDERFELTFMLIDASRGYLDYLKEQSAKYPRVRFRDPVPMRQLAGTANEYDLGLFVLPPVNFSYRYALPNKLFEFIQGRLGIAIGPSPEMARVVKEHDLGVVADDFAPRAVAERLNALTDEDVLRFKVNSDKVAHRYSADTLRQVLLELVASVLR